MDFYEFLDALQDCIDDFDGRYAPVAVHQLIQDKTENFEGLVHIPDFFGYETDLYFDDNEYGKVISFYLYTHKKRSIDSRTFRLGKYSEDGAQKIFDFMMEIVEEAQHNASAEYEKYI